LIYTPVAGSATDALVHVNGVIEIDKIRQVMNLDPRNGLASGPTVANRLQQLRIGPDLRVAIDTGSGWRNSGVTRFLNRGVTVLALQAQALHMMLVAERDRLFRTLTLPRHPGRTLQLIERNSQGNHDQPRQHEAHTSQRIGAAVKNLRHEVFFLLGFSRLNSTAVLAVTLVVYKNHRWVKLTHDEGNPEN
jgi:hypothetical protein